MYRFIINKRYVDLLRVISKPQKHNVLDVSREMSLAYGQASSYISQFAKEGLLMKKRLDTGPGIQVDVLITEKGKAIIACFDKIDEIMKKEFDVQIEDEKEVKNGKN